MSCNKLKNYVELTDWKADMVNYLKEYCEAK